MLRFLSAIPATPVRVPQPWLRIIIEVSEFSPKRLVLLPLLLPAGDCVTGSLSTPGYETLMGRVSELLGGPRDTLTDDRGSGSTSDTGDEQAQTSAFHSLVSCGGGRADQGDVPCQAGQRVRIWQAWYLGNDRDIAATCRNRH